MRSWPRHARHTFRRLQRWPRVEERHHPSDDPCARREATSLVCRQDVGTRARSSASSALGSEFAGTEEGEALSRLKTYADHGQVELAEHLAEIVLKSSDSGPARKSLVCNAVIIASCNADEPVAAARWLGTMAEERLDISAGALDSVLRAVAEKRGVEAADRWYDTLDGEGQVAERIRHRLAFHARAWRCEDVLDAEIHVLKLLSARVQDEDRRIAGIGILVAVARSSDPGRSALWLARFNMHKLDVGAAGVRTVLYAHARLGDVAAAEMLLPLTCEAVATARTASTDVCVPDDAKDAALLSCFNTVLRACSTAGSPGKAEEWLSRMRLSRVRPDHASHVAMMQSLASLGRRAAVERRLVDLPREGVLTSSSSFHAVLRACAQEGDAKRAISWVSRMCGAGELPDHFCYNFVLAACAQAGDTLVAEACFSSMKGSLSSPPDAYSYASFAAAHSRAGNFADAELTLVHAQESLPVGSGPSASAFLSLVRRCARAGDAARAGRLLACMTRGELLPTKTALYDVLQCCSPSFAGVALQSLQLLEMLALRSGSPLPAHAYRLALQPYADMGDWQQVERTLSLVSCPSTLLAAELRLAALANAVPPQRPRTMRAASLALLAGAALGEDLRRALGGRRVTPRRDGATARDPVPAASADVACVSRVRAALDAADPQLVESWLRRWALVARRASTRMRRQRSERSVGRHTRRAGTD